MTYENQDLDTSTEEVGEETVIKSRETITGDLTSWLVDRIKHLPSTWAQMTEEEQRGVIDSAERAVESAVEQVVGTISADGRTVLGVNIGDVKIPGDLSKQIEAKISTPHTAANVATLGNRAGMVALLVIADASQYQGGDVPEPDPDQAVMLEGDDGSPMDNGQGFGSGEKEA